MSEPHILVVNLGAASSKFALFAGTECLTEASVPLSNEVARLSPADQRPVRLAHLHEFLRQHNVQAGSLAGVASRGGLMKPLSTLGVYRVDGAMVEDLASERYGSHPASLSAILAYDFSQSQQPAIPVFVVDPITTDTLWDEARLSGVPEIVRSGRHHALNVHRVSRLAAERLGKPLHACNLVVGHFGSGVSICSVVGGRVVDVNDAQLGEGPFSVARAGTLPIRGVLDLAYAEPDRKRLEQRVARASGMAAYVGTAGFPEIERLLSEGSGEAHRAYRAMVFQSAKYLAAAAGALGAPPDAIVLTGGLMNSERFTADIEQRICWLAPVICLPGEEEMAALAEGVYAALRGAVPVFEYGEAETPSEAPPRMFSEVLSRALRTERCAFVVAGGNQAEVAETVCYCLDEGIRGFTLVGPASEITAALVAEGVSAEVVRIVDSNDVVSDAIAFVKATPRAVLVKGNCNTAALLKAVLDCLPKDRRPFLSHVAVIENPMGGRLVGITDGGLNVEPDLEKKIAIMENAIAAFLALGVKRPHVLLAAGMEDKGQDVPAIADAREIVKRHRDGAWPEAVIDGPFGFDVGLSSEAAALKGIRSDVAGRADIILTPSLESCNFAVKAVTLYSGQPWAGLVVGGPFPVIVGSRSDDAPSRVASIAFARLVTAGMAKLAAKAHG